MQVHGDIFKSRYNVIRDQSLEISATNSYLRDFGYFPYEKAGLLESVQLSHMKRDFNVGTQILLWLLKFLT